MHVFLHPAVLQPQCWATVVKGQVKRYFFLLQQWKDQNQQFIDLINNYCLHSQKLIPLCHRAWLLSKNYQKHIHSFMNTDTSLFWVNLLYIFLLTLTLPLTIVPNRCTSGPQFELCLFKPTVQLLSALFSAECKEVEYL